MQQEIGNMVESAVRNWVHDRLDAMQTHLFPVPVPLLPRAPEEDNKQHRFSNKSTKRSLAPIPRSPTTRARTPPPPSFIESGPPVTNQPPEPRPFFSHLASKMYKTRHPHAFRPYNHHNQHASSSRVGHPSSSLKTEGQHVMLVKIPVKPRPIPLPKEEDVPAVKVDEEFKKPISPTLPPCEDANDKKPTKWYED
ncbi:MAG: hypothetical protein KGQ60_17795 [Planctomycetes bacterium]|nr:hypothetical protein [Planctomycetota bacterium]